MKNSAIRSLALAGVALALPALVDRVARRAAGRGFSAITGAAPPRNPATPGVSWGQAILWTALAGAICGVARMSARRALSGAGLPTEE